MDSVPVCLSVCMYVCMYVCMFGPAEVGTWWEGVWTVYLSVCLSVCMYVCMYVCSDLLR